MELIKFVALLVVGFVLLIKGADFFVEGSASVAKKMKVPPMIIGLTIVAMGTSAPECAVSITASVQGANTLAVSNVVGSNLFNLLVVCGICALIVPLVVHTSTVKKEFPFSILVGLVLLVMSMTDGVVSRMEGIILLILFVLFLMAMVKNAINAKDTEELDDGSEIKDISVSRCIIYIAGGIVAIVLGGDMVVDGAVGIAESFGLSSTLIGLTIVAIGTSLPELVTSLVAAKKNQIDMAVGNVIGSNIFNILLIIGLAATISPITIQMENVIDLVVLAVASLVAYLFCVVDKLYSKYEGIVMILMYTAFIVYTCVR